MAKKNPTQQEKDELALGKRPKLRRTVAPHRPAIRPTPTLKRRTNRFLRHMKVYTPIGGIKNFKKACMRKAAHCKGWLKKANDIPAGFDRAMAA
jgi:hypothetical protein